MASHCSSQNKYLMISNYHLCSKVISEIALIKQSIPVVMEGLTERGKMSDCQLVMSLNSRSTDSLTVLIDWLNSIIGGVKTPFLKGAMRCTLKG